MTTQDFFDPADIDSIFHLPLASVAGCFDSRALAKTVLTKDRYHYPKLGSLVEFYSHDRTGRALRSLPDTIKELNLATSDAALAAGLGRLPAYDPFSLRRSLRREVATLTGRAPESIDIHPEALRLSPDGVRRLSAYTRLFTRPLMCMVVGDGAEGVDDPKAFVALVDRAVATGDTATIGTMRTNLERLGRAIGATDPDSMRVELDNFGEVILSLGYLKDYYYRALNKPLRGLLDEMRTLRDGRDLPKMRPGFKPVIGGVVSTLDRTLAVVETVLEEYDHNIISLWQDVTPERFGALKGLIEDSHEVIAASLCGWGVRLQAWEQALAKAPRSALATKADFVTWHVYAGMQEMPDVTALSEMVKAAQSMRP